MNRVQHRGYTLTKHGARWRWEARAAGRKIKRSFPTLEQATSALDAFLESRALDNRRESTAAHIAALGTGHITIAELCARWFAWKTGPRSDEPIGAATRHDYRYVIDHYIGTLIGSLDAATVSTNDLRREFFRVCPSRTKARFSRTVLKQAFRWAIEERIVGRRDNPVVDIRLPRREAHDGRNRRMDSVRTVTDEEIPKPGEVEQMLAWAAETGRSLWWLWVYITATLGLRPSETCALRREDFDAKAGVVRIRRSVPHPSDETARHPKTETSLRDLEVDADFFARVLPHLPSEGWVFDYAATPGRKPGRRTSTIPCWPAYVPCREMQKMRHALRLPDVFTPYCLRHFVATRLILAGRREIQVAKWLGTSVEMLQKVYAFHLDRDAQRTIGRTVTKLFDVPGTSGDSQPRRPKTHHRARPRAPATHSTKANPAAGASRS